MQEIKEVTVAELRSLFHSKQYDIEIDTPDGFASITRWFDKGLLPTVKIKTANGLETICAANHLLQSDDSQWKQAGEYKHGDILLTEHGHDTIVSITKNEMLECFDFAVEHPNHRYWGDGISSHNSGKSYLVSGNIIKDAQRQDIFPFLFDTENALDSTWLQALGVDTSEERLYKASAAKIDDVAHFLAEFIDAYKADHSAKPREERPKILFVIDSLGMLITPGMEKQYDEGDMKGDMGLKAKQMTALLRTTLAKIAAENMGLVCTNHVYDSQDQYKPDKISGGMMVEFAPSVIIQMNRLLLKEDEFGNDLPKGEIAGIKSSMMVRKCRYAKPFERIKVNIPYDTGMNPYSGMFDLCQKKGLVVKDGNRWAYESPVTKTVIKEYRKDFGAAIFDTIMAEWHQWESQAPVDGFDHTDDNETP